jgi:DNA-binding MarR family transcriptional regulator
MPARGDSQSEAADRQAHQLTDVVTRLRRALRSSIRSDYSWEQLPMAQVEMLQVLAEQSPLRVSEIAARQQLAASTVSGLVGQLMTAGLVERTTDPTDRRASAVTLTTAGADQLDAWLRANERRLADALAALTADDRARVRDALPALQRLAGALERPTG